MDLSSSEVVVPVKSEAEGDLKQIWDSVSESGKLVPQAKLLLKNGLRLWIRRSVAKKRGHEDLLDVRTLELTDEQDISTILNALSELIDAAIQERWVFRTFATACRVHAERDWGLRLV